MFTRICLFVCTLSLLYSLLLPHGASAHLTTRSYTPSPTINPLEWAITRIGGPAGWAQGATGAGVHILVVDTGLDPGMLQSALAGSILPSLALPLHVAVPVACPPGKGGENYGGDPLGVPTCTKLKIVANPTPYKDDVGHGSGVTCLIVCHGLSYQYYGIAPQARVSMAKVFGSGEGATSPDIAAAIRWGAVHKFPLISLSLGSPQDDPAIHAAVAFAQKMGTLVIAASGNDGNGSLSYPAGDPGVISVTASDRWGKLASYANYGTGLSITAPGDWVFTLGPMHPTAINCGGFCSFEGTSISTPLVTGVLADLMSVGLSPKQAEQALFAGAVHWPGMPKLSFGAGIVDLVNSLHWARAQHLLPA